MPSVLIYALTPDLRTVVDHLNDDSDIAFIISDGPGRWRAVDHVTDLSAGQHALWLRAHGPLPLVPESPLDPVAPIADPMAGWNERASASSPGVPFFGSDPSVVWLQVPQFSEQPKVPMSAFGWMGDRYRTAGPPANPEATVWWRQLKQWIRTRTELVKRGGPTGVGPKDVAAFPEASCS